MKLNPKQLAVSAALLTLLLVPLEALVFRLAFIGRQHIAQIAEARLQAHHPLFAQ